MKITHRFNHYTAHEANKTLKWVPNDLEELFKERLKNEPTNPSLNYYLKNPISYKLNNYGFRSPVDYVEGIEGNVFLGCSHTFGIGHHLENTWSWKLNEYVGGNFINLSVGGTGIGTGFRLLYGMKDIVKPKNVFLFYPHVYRYEYFDQRYQTWANVCITQLYKIETRNKKFLLEQNNAEMFYYLHYTAIKNLCYELDIPLYNVTEFNKFWEDPDENSPLPLCARDDHPNPKFHVNVFEKFKQIYDNKINIYKRPEELCDLKYNKGLKPIL